MRIGIDGFNLALPNGTGIATYALGLAQVAQAANHEVNGLFGIDAGDNPATLETRFFDALGRGPLDRSARYQKYRDFLRGVFGVRMKEVPLTDAVVKEPFVDRLPRFDRLFTTYRLFRVADRHFRLTGRFLSVRMDDPPEIMHWTYPLPLRLKGARNIYTLHDLVPLKLPYTTLDNKEAYHSLIKRCVETADHIVTISEASRADIISLFGEPRGGISNLSQTVPARLANRAATDVDAADYVKSLFGLAPKGYFLFFGAIEPKKNLGRLIEAYLSLRTDSPLVIVGGRSWQSEEELHLLESGLDNQAGRILRLSYLSRDQLDRLISQAKAVCFPSIYEGFGLPVLEAMVLGAPVITSRLSSLPEVVGDAGLMVDPYDVNDIRDALARIDTDAELAAELRARGRKQAEKFNAADYAQRVDQLYRTLAN